MYQIYKPEGIILKIEYINVGASDEMLHDGWRSQSYELHTYKNVLYEHFFPPSLTVWET